MGDRANVYVHDGEEPGVYLYTHWQGSELPEIVRVAIDKQWRWADCPYLTRIIFSEMIKESLHDETGYGISAQVGDGEGRIVDVDTGNQRVRIGAKGWSFEEFSKLEGVGW